MGFNVFLPNQDERLKYAGFMDPATQITPDSAFEGLTTAVGKGVVGAAASAGTALSDAAAKFSELQLEAQGVKGVELEAPMADTFQAVEKWSKIDPRTTGGGAAFVGNLARGITLFGMGSLAGGPAGGAGLIGSAEGYTHYRDLREKGVDKDTAMASGVTNGVMLGLGAFLPIKGSGALGETVGQSLLGAGVRAEMAGAEGTASALYSMANAAAVAATKTNSGFGAAAYVAAVNAAFGAGSRAMTSTILENGGYPDLAKQYEALDFEALAADAVLGLAFHGIDRLVSKGEAKGEEQKPPTVTDDVIEAALETRREEMIARGAAGIPTTVETGVLDRDLQDRAVANMLQNKLPDIDAKEAAAIVEGTVIDPQRAAIFRQAGDSMVEFHGPLADATPFARVEAPDDTLLTPPSPVEKLMDETAKTETTIKLDPVLESNINQIASAYGDLEVEMPDGSMVKASDVAGKIKQDLLSAEEESKLHDVAVACFLRTL